MNRVRYLRNSDRKLYRGRRSRKKNPAAKCTKSIHPFCRIFRKAIYSASVCSQSLDKAPEKHYNKIKVLYSVKYGCAPPRMLGVSSVRYTKPGTDAGSS